MRLLTAAALASATAAFAAYAVRGKSSALLGPSVWHGPRDVRAVALTFDDGPSESTPAVLELLAQYDARATFFLCGENVRRLPGIARAIVEAGHEIGNHTQTHARLWLRSPAFIDREFAAAQRTIQEVTGITPALLRAPYGVRWPGMRRTQQRLGLLGVMWTVIGSDWSQPADRIAERVLSRAQPGGIICLHDGRELTPNPDIGPTVEALRRILPALEGRGYALPTVSQLLSAHL